MWQCFESTQLCLKLMLVFSSFNVGAPQWSLLFIYNCTLYIIQHSQLAIFNPSTWSWFEFCHLLLFAVHYASTYFFIFLTTFPRVGFCWKRKMGRIRTENLLVTMIGLYLYTMVTPYMFTGSSGGSGALIANQG